MTWTRRVVAGASLAVATLLALASPAAAHASLQEATPAADSVVEAGPDVVELRFDEPVDASLGGITVIAPGGGRADEGVADEADGGRIVRTEVDADKPGSYLVEWAVMSEDGHLLEGSLVFSVGRTSAVASPSSDERTGTRLLAGAARLVAYAGTLLLVGILTITVLESRRQRLASAAAAAAGATVVAGIVLLLTQTALASGRPLLGTPSLIDSTLGTRTGALAGLRLSLAVLAVSAALLWRALDRGFPVQLLVIATAGLVTVPALAGHAWTTSPRALAVTVDIGHLVVTGIWLGGLAAIALLSWRGDELPDRLRRFSPFAAWGLLITVATGAISSWLQTRSVAAVTDTGYGKLLIVKVLLVAAVVAAAYANRRLLSNLRLRRQLQVVAAELTAAIVVLAVTAALVNQPPARDTVARPVSVLADSTGDLDGTIEVQVQPARAGSNDIHAYFFDSDGVPRAVDAAEIRVGRPGQAVRPVKVTPLTREHVSALGVTLPTAGAWEITVTSIADGLASTANVEVPVR